MKKILVHLESGQLCDIVEPGSEFSVAAGLQWFDAPDDVSHATHEFRDGAIELKPEPPPPPPPAKVTMRQARLALLAHGLLQQVNDAVNAMPGVEGEAARIEWEYALSVDRASPLVAGLSAALNLSAAQLDALFMQASTL